MIFSYDQSISTIHSPPSPAAKVKVKAKAQAPAGELLRESEDASQLSYIMATYQPFIRLVGRLWLVPWQWSSAVSPRLPLSRRLDLFQR